MNIRIGTRGSQLALWQAYHVRDMLEAAGLTTEIITIETKGDKVLDVSIAKIGSKGVFTEEIEEQLANGHIDIAVHSAKDMQSSLPDGFELIAFMEREEVNDVMISHKENVSLSDPDLLLGTSSTRRVATLRHFYPHVKTVPVRGNLQTRIRKMEEGACDALLLAYAGVHRMGYDDKIKTKLNLNEFIPAVGQGSVTIEVHETLSSEKRDRVKEILNHDDTASCLIAERAYLKTMDGGCSIPVFGLAQLTGEEIEIKGGIISLDGGQRILKEKRGPVTNAEKLGEQLANEVLSSGGKEILEEIKEKLNDE
ncbi:hydroxymethylbilane synthase [Roseivirga sp.]|uniref:hydroxymethylbilane synthase n=1 Tax=Roseivirga sp. TaxID=1964215 RepID=UPI003B52D07D